MTGATQPTKTVWVGNLDHSVTEETLRSLFANMGPIKSIRRGTAADAFSLQH